MRGFGTLVGSLLAIGLVASAAHGATLRVPADYPSVLEGVDAASPGDTVLVAPGTWTDYDRRYVVINGELWNLYSTAFLGPGVNLVAEAGPEATILDLSEAPDLGDTILLTGESPGESPESNVIDGFTITGNGEGLVIDYPGRTEIRNCRISDNGLVGLAAIRAELVVSECEFRGNNRLAGDLQRYAIDLRWGASLEMTGSVVADNHRGGMWLRNCPSILIEDCDFLDNPNDRAGRVSYCPDLRIRSSRFFRNSSLTANGGALSISSSTGTVEFCVFAHDTSHAGFGGALAATSTTILALSNNTFFDCHARAEGGAVLFILGSQFEFANNVVAHCTGSAALAGAPEASGCNVLWDNPEGDYHNVWTPDPTDIHADPLFCDPEVDDLTVYTTSPCVAENSPQCGAIGALGAGCQPLAVEPSVESRMWGEIKSPYRVPR
jgi:hypothetical protein